MKTTTTKTRKDRSFETIQNTRKWKKMNIKSKRTKIIHKQQELHTSILRERRPQKQPEKKNSWSGDFPLFPLSSHIQTRKLFNLYFYNGHLKKSISLLIFSLCLWVKLLWNCWKVCNFGSGTSWLRDDFKLFLFYFLLPFDFLFFN